MAERFVRRGMGGRTRVLLVLAAAAPWVLAFTPDPRRPNLPAEPYKYADSEVGLPAYLTDPRHPSGNIAIRDNTPENNPITNDGATLGRVLFYDKRLSKNEAVACATCHPQKHGFSDPLQFSKGFEGRTTKRHSMSLGNARFYMSGQFFWDQRAASLEQQVLMPIQDEIEMGLTLDEMEARLRATDFYGPLFEKAFGTPEINRERVAKALAQFVRSLVSHRSRFDQALQKGSFAEFSPAENQGRLLFNGRARCGNCHITAVQILNLPQNNGLDEDSSHDPGWDEGRFKAPSLRNIEVTGPYMHDGRIETLREVVQHYNSNLKPNPFLDAMLGGRRPVKLGLTEEEVDAVVAFMKTLTDEAFLTDPKFSDPFPQ